ncbi:MAG: DUF4253 domain-containing protein [Lachnospiraceae bacterium]|nr:DUF4253 domain-containing protein [Lachnospiraceae bacterium]
MDKYTKKIKKLLACESIVVEPQQNATRLLEMFYAIKSQGEQSGFTPVIIVPGKHLADTLKKCKKPEYYLKEYKNHDGAAILAGYLDEIKKDIASSGEDWKDVVSDVERGQGINDFAGFLPPDWDETLEVLIAKVPTQNPWEIFAWVPMGGFRECPPTEYMMSIFKKWYEEWQFVPAVICEDMVEGFAPKKPSDETEAVSIATEHYAFCPDLIEQCCSDCTIGQWADCLLQSDKWFFWWD